MNKNFKKKIVYLVVLLIPLFLFSKNSKTIISLKFKLINIVSGPLSLISKPIKEVEKILNYRRIFNEYKRLEKENNRLKSRIIGFEEVLKENTRLEKLLNFKRKLIYSYVAASVVGRDPSLWNSSMVIDKGANDGIKKGMPVVNALGVVGKIFEVGENKSKVVLLTDPSFSVAALVQGARESGLVKGNLQGLCQMTYIDENAKIKVGEKVITSKLSSSFPESLLIGEIIQINKSSQDASFECIVKPVVSFSQIEEVLVIKSP